VVDTGVQANHTDFQGIHVGSRVKAGYDDFNQVHGDGRTDCNGHGTHVASISSGVKWGMAPRSWVVPVRVMDCRGSGKTSAVVRGINWVRLYKAKRKVVNFSISGGRSSSIDFAIDKLVNSGAIVVCAAGNNNYDACLRSPGRNTRVITVASLDRDDRRSSFSNYGQCVNIFAPGRGIEAADSERLEGSTVKSGTSMASPFTTGVIAGLWSVKGGWSRQKVSSTVLSKWGHKGLIRDTRLSANVALINRFTPQPPATSEPTTAPTTAPTIFCIQRRQPTNCELLNSTSCSDAWDCQYFDYHRCKTYDFCGFTKRSVCTSWAHCNWGADGCKIRQNCDSYSKSDCLTKGCYWEDKQCKKSIRV
nr:S8 family peptidase [Gammaproteobacteria bacterium]